jgi:ATP-dependent Lhr-like helicase
MNSEDHSKLDWAHPVVRDWFLENFGSATEPQGEGWPHILAGRTTLISAPTGSGKTLAAFLACIDTLVRKALDGKLAKHVSVVYVSPLKALSNDIHKNLELPLKQITQLAADRGLKMDEIRLAVRTGDTPASERQSMLRKPPHILVTTPESLYILLTAEKSRAILGHVETVIVDEIHAMADDKRGAHLSLSLERLDSLSAKKPNRIALSATQKPIELMAHFIAGNGAALPVIVDVGQRRKLDLAVEVPDLTLGPIVTHEIWEWTYKRIAQLANEHRSTLIFVNTRKLAERVAMQLSQILGEDAVATHHGSLSRKLRLAAERKLKNGEVKALVATASLELGIDIGFVDLVCQISSPRSIATALQRIGRAGHWRGAIPKGRLFALTRDELVELAALTRAIRQTDLDKLVVPDAPVDILAQQIVAICASEDWREDDLFTLVKRAYPYGSLTREKFDSIITMLSEGISSARGRYGSYLLRDQVNHKVKGRRGARMTAITNGGAIPETNSYAVVVEPEEATVGTLDEDFAVESNKGDIILLGNSSWRVRRVENKAGRVLVEDARGMAPTVPFWLGEGPARTVELSQHVADLRKSVSDMTSTLRPDLTLKNNEQFAKTREWLKSECLVDDSGANQLAEYIIEGRAVLGTVPTKQTVIAERFFDEGGGMQLVIHAPFGGRINKAWGLALRKKFCRSFNFELQAAGTDNGLVISLAEQHSFPLPDVFQYLNSATVRHDLEQAALAAPVFATRWRWDATRSLALLRFANGKKVPPYLQRMRSDDLLASVFPQAAACQDNQVGDIELPDHPLVNEVMKDVLYEAMDLAGLEKVLDGIANKEIECVAIDTPIPSAFSHEIINANPYAYLDDAPLEERRSRAVEMRRVTPADFAAEMGKLDQQAIERVFIEAWPDLRNADELHDFLQTVIVLPEELPSFNCTPPKSSWVKYLDDLVAEQRATRATANDVTLWVCAERLRAFQSVYEHHQLQRVLPEVTVEGQTPEEVIHKIVQGWMTFIGPTTVRELAALLHLPPRDIEIAMLKLEASGAVLRGNFRDVPTGEQGDLIQWCERRLLARIHNLTITKLRGQIEAVSPAIFVRWLAHWQHVAPGTQLSGERGTLEVIRQLQGFEIPANAWEDQILSQRISDYEPEILDNLCLTGAIGWGRLSPHPALYRKESSTAGGDFDPSTNPNGNGKTTVSSPKNNRGRRVIPTSVAPITFFVRDDADWLTPHHTQNNSTEELNLSTAARAVKQFLTQRGASFFPDIVRATNLLKAEVETALWELVAAGYITADGFDNIRALIDPHRRTGRGRGRHLRPRDSTGRWSLLYSHDAIEGDRAIEATCRMLLNRYGIVFRDLLLREANIPSWRSLLYHFRLMEARGEVRGGRFVSGFNGEQFALPVALESLRLMRGRQPANTRVVLSASDPLNLFGIVLPGDKVAATPGNMFALPL